MSFVGFIKADEVVDAKSFASFVQQTCGTPYCTQQDLIALHKQLKEFKERYPHLAENPWPTLVKTAQWVRSKRKRPSRVQSVVNPMLSWAWQDGALPELDPTCYRDPVVEEEISVALGVEDDALWRDRLINAEGFQARKGVLEAWKQRSTSSLLL
jgi:hypothetical protein